MGANSLSVFNKIKFEYLLNWIVILEGPRKWRDNCLKHFFFRRISWAYHFLPLSKLSRKSFKKEFCSQQLLDQYPKDQYELWILVKL